jgi:hypothetical protein
MILEGLISTVDEAGQPHISAIGPTVDESFTRFVLRPFRTSRTFHNLQRSHQAVFHVTDDAEAIAAAVCGKEPSRATFFPAKTVRGFVLSTACRAYELEITEFDTSDARALLNCRVTLVHRMRDFFGFNRAKHAVVEAAILASRVGIVPENDIRSEWNHLRTLVEKTGGSAEHRAFEQLAAFIENAFHKAVI